MITKFQSELRESLKSAIFYGSFAIVFLFSYLEIASPKMEAIFESHGFYGHKTYGGRFKYITYINLFMQILYFGLMGCNSLIEAAWLYLAEDKSYNLHKIRQRNYLRLSCNEIFTGIAFPFAVFVVTQFWTFFLLDRDLVFSAHLERVMPRYQNHIMHTLPLVAVLLDSYFFRHIYHRSFIRGSLVHLTFTAGCLTWTLIVARNGGFWPYPFIGTLTTAQRLALFTFVCVYLAALYKAGEILHKKFWEFRSSKKHIFSKISSYVGLKSLRNYSTTPNQRLFAY